MAHRRLHRPLIVILALVSLLSLQAFLPASSAQLLQRQLKLSNNTGGATATYSFSFQPTTLDALQTIVLQICANDPFPNTPCTPPVGLDASNATLLSEDGDLGFSVASQTTANEIVLQRAPFSSNGQLNTYELGGITNPTNTGSYYVRVLTYSDADTNGAPTHYGGIAFAIASGVDVTVTVPPYLLFCAGVTVNGMNCDNVVGDYVNFGEFSSRQASQGSTQMLAATNALDGYSIRVAGTTLTSGTNAIPGLVGSDVSRPGVSQFGMNLRANSSPQGGTDVTGSGVGLPTNGYDQVNFFRFNSGDVVAASPAPDYARKYTATYVVNVSSSQSPGVYVSTLTYIALGSF